MSEKNLTKFEGMSDFLVVPESHTYIMYSALVQDEVHFLKHWILNYESD